MLAEPDDVHRLVNMQRPCFTRGVAPIVIVHTIGNIRLLLNFAKNETRSNRVNGSRWNKNCVASLRGNPHDEVLDRGVVNRAAERISFHPGFQAKKNFAAGPSRYEIPHFRFAAPAGLLFMLRGIVVVGMNLHGKFVVRENELNKYWKRALGPQLRPCTLDRHLRPGFA